MAGLPFSLADLNLYTGKDAMAAIDAGRKERTLADLGQYAAKGDYQGAASAAFAGGQPDIATALAKMGRDQHQQLVQDAGSGAYAADTPEKWEQFKSQFEATHPGFDVPPFAARDVVIKQAMSVQDQMQNALAQRKLALDERSAGVPSGFQRGANGSLQPIPGGPSDPAYIARAAGARGGPLFDMGGGTGADLASTEGTDTLPGAAAPVAPSFQTVAAEMGQGPGTRNEAYLAKFPPELQSLIKGVANYELDPTKSTSIRGNQRAQIITFAKMYDPTYDMSQLPARAAMRKSVTSGQFGQNIQALNLSLQHLGSLEGEIDALGNGNFTPLNALKNSWRGMTGDPNITNFRQNAMAVATEVAKVFRGVGAMSEREIHDWMGNFDVNASPEQMQGAIDKARELLSARLDTISSQYRMTMGKPIDFTVLTPHTMETLTPEARRIMGMDENPGGLPASGGGWTIEPAD